MTDAIRTEDVELTVRVAVPKIRAGEVLRIAWDRDASVNPRAYAEIYFAVTRVDLRGTYSFVDGKPSVATPSGEVFGVVQKGRTVGGDMIRPGQVLAFDPAILARDATRVEWKDPIVEADTTDNVDTRVRIWDAAKRAR